MNYFLEHWGGFVGVLGLILTIIGVVLSYAAFRRAGKARDAAEGAEAAAEKASRDTREAINSSFTTVDLERAIALVQRIKDLHRRNRWETSLEHFQPVRVMLSDILSSHGSLSPELRAALNDAILNLTQMENAVSLAVTQMEGLEELRRFERELNRIQELLTIISSSIRF